LITVNHRRAPLTVLYYYYYIRLMAFFQDNLGRPAPER